jgi:hypothetical protein
MEYLMALVYLICVIILFFICLNNTHAKTYILSIVILIVLYILLAYAPNTIESVVFKVGGMNNKNLFFSLNSYIFLSFVSSIIQPVLIVIIIFKKKKMT